MKKTKKVIFTHVLNIVTIALIIECFLCALLAVRVYAREDCFKRIKETTQQVSEMLEHSVNDGFEKLNAFAGFVGTNSSNTDEELLSYMENFCKTQYFTGLCVHRKNGDIIPFGTTPQTNKGYSSFESEVNSLPYISGIYSMGDDREQKYIYQAVPIYRGENVVGILYGYMPLSSMPEFVTSSAYGGEVHYFVIERKTGDFLMDTWNEKKLGNIEDLSVFMTEKGYSYDNMYNVLILGGYDYYSFKSARTGNWIYAYFMPTKIDDWSVMITINRQTAFASYNSIGESILILSVAVVVLMFVHVGVLMLQTANVKQKDKKLIRKTNYVNEIQRLLLNVQNNGDFIEQALKVVADEIDAETVMLLTFQNRTITNAYYWPSTDKSQAMNMLGRKIREDFPVMFDMLYESKSVFLSKEDSLVRLSETELDIFKSLDVSNIMLVPIVDNVGMLKGAISAVNFGKEVRDCEMLECITYDFFMAIANMENHAIIKEMGTIDYLTKIKNRNSYEAEISGYVTEEGENLWCIYVDVNGLHEVNNTQGHKAGDMMLCAVADSLKKYFGDKNTYRLGGDEFVCFAVDSVKEEINRRKKKVKAELATKGYYVSIGYESVEKDSEGMFDVNGLVERAESIMYREKWEYYQKNNIQTDRGHFPKSEEFKDGSKSDTKL